MKTLVAAFITALLVFTLATVWIDIVQPRLDLLAVAMASQSNGKGANGSNGRLASKDMNAIDEDSDELERSESSALRVKKSIKNNSRRVLEKKERDLEQAHRDEQTLSKMVELQNTMKMLYDDLLKVVKDEEKVRRQSSNELAVVEKQFLESTLSNVGATAAKNEAAKSAAKRKSDGDQKFADIVQGLVNRDKGKVAAQLLSGLDDRKAAKILSLVNDRDPKTATRLSNQIQEAKQDSIQRF